MTCKDKASYGSSPPSSVLLIRATGWQRPTGCLIFMGHFLQKSSVISGSFAENDWQFKAFYGSTPPCSVLLIWVTPRFSNSDNRDMTHSCVWRDSFIYATWLIHIRDMTHSYMWHDSFVYVTWLIHRCDTTHSYVWHHSFICVACLIHVCDMTHTYTLFTHGLPRVCDMTHLFMWHGSIKDVTRIHESVICVAWLFQV